ncbi:hypothetical protein CHS0354_037457 [Potamilus streckersoni]|uniref:Uncharacterized protein n=1 Tax=Potamilus streckersoni TaxID=2493646 RepID=A0AAE0VHQ4_9BIVA|nr:hypothetical protein CHS0354_037457 [Potamilus streckersoni]
MPLQHINITNVDYTIREIYSSIRTYINTKWQLQWENSATYTLLHQLQSKGKSTPTTPIDYTSRKHNKITNRLRTGKTLLQSNLGKHLKDRRQQTTTCVLYRTLYILSSTSAPTTSSNEQNSADINSG